MDFYDIYPFLLTAGVLIIGALDVAFDVLTSKETE
jgi:hypothetical protein